MARIILRGGNHAFMQIAEFPFLPKFLLQFGRKRHCAEIANIIERCGTTEILEEANDRYDSIAQMLAKRYGLPYSNINMPPEKRVAVGLAAGLDENAINPEHPNFQIREDYMVERIVERAVNENIVLAICGKAHVPGLKKKLQERDVDVEVEE